MTYKNKPIMATTTKTRKFKADPKAAQEKREAAMDKLEQGIQSLLDSDRWQDYLKFHSGFHHYSWNNTMLIYMQCPTATQVAGFHDWLKRGRYVKKGEKGISILAPAPYKIKETNDRGEEIESKRMCFKTVTVFNVDQTDGEPLPESPVKLLEGDDAGLFDRLHGYAQSLNIPVNIKPLPCNGHCRYEGEKPVEIAINPELSPLQSAKTLSHELAHAILHSELQYRMHEPTSLLELEAESTAFIVCNHFGFDTGEYSFGYISGHCSKDTIKTLKESAARITQAAKQIIDWIEEQLTETQT